jgi:hypothetical protein
MKAMRVVITVLLLVLALPALAQYTTVTGTVTDSAGTPYANGSFGIDYVNGAGCAGLAPAFAANPNGVLPSHWGGGFLASTGALPSMSVPDNALLVCSTSQWKYTICSNSGSTCFTSSITITGASQNIGSTLVSASTAIPGTNAAAFTSTAANPSLLAPPLPRPPSMTYGQMPRDCLCRPLRLAIPSAWTGHLSPYHPRRQSLLSLPFRY